MCVFSSRSSLVWLVCATCAWGMVASPPVWYDEFVYQFNDTFGPETLSPNSTVLCAMYYSWKLKMMRNDQVWVREDSAIGRNMGLTSYIFKGEGDEKDGGIYGTAYTLNYLDNGTTTCRQMPNQWIFGPAILTTDQCKFTGEVVIRGQKCDEYQCDGIPDAKLVIFDVVSGDLHGALWHSKQVDSSGMTQLSDLIDYFPQTIPEDFFSLPAQC